MYPDLDAIWLSACKIFPILEGSLATPAITTISEVELFAKKIDEIGVSEKFHEIVLIKMDRMLRKETVPAFWNYFRTENLELGFSLFHEAVEKLYEEYLKYQTLLKNLQYFKKFCSFQNTKKSEFKIFDMKLRSTLLSQLPANFDNIVYSFYKRSFQVFAKRQDFDGQTPIPDQEARKCDGCDVNFQSCQCQELILAFNKTNKYLIILNLLDKLAGFTLTQLIQERIACYVQETCKGIYDASHLESLEKWLNSIVLNWLTKIFNKGLLKIDEEDKKTQEAINNFKIKLSYHMYETYANIIIEQFFNIIIDYPDSEPAIDDLKLCLDKLDMRKHLIDTLKKSLEARLLHPGVNTMDILTGYVAAIKAIRHLDNSGVLLETVTKPIKDYLKKRNDTVRRVITGLTEEGPTDLAEELAKSETLKDIVDVSRKDEMVNWKDWNPDPIDASPLPKLSTNSRSADIISMVVDIYGSKELFVNEYRNLLADRLLTQLDFSPEREIRNLELLKLRFGEMLLHSCEVMLKDISDSKRINTHIQNDINYNEGKNFDISSLILSSQFWPSFNKETLELPEEIQNEFKNFTTSYESYKGNRTLLWRPVTGRVEIELELSNKTLEMSVTPTQAVIIYHFQNKNQWTIEELSKVIKVPPSILRKRMMFWQTLGFIKENPTDVYTFVDESDIDSEQKINPNDLCEEDESESAMASASDQREEELQVFWSYIVGMLTNLDSLPIERIHQMLKMFASHGPGVEFSQDELKNFLQRKVREHKLLFAGGAYQLPK